MTTSRYGRAARRGLSVLALAGAALGLAACGGSTPSTDASAARGSGTVGILLTDAPADPGLFEAINVTIESIQLLGEPGKVEIFSGPPETHDLLELTHESVPFGFHDGVPAGEYCKIRLILSDLELVLADDTPADPTDNETYHPHLPGNGKLDLVARDCFAVEPGRVLTLQVDMDAGKSIHVVGNRKKFNFRPVVFIDVVDGGFPARLLRLEGRIARVDAAAGSLLLCDALPHARGDVGNCAELRFGDDAAFFDNETQGGAPRPLAELLNDDQVGKPLVAVGRPRHGSLPPPPDFDIPADSLPQPGECRLWRIGVEPEAQPAPIDCDDLPLPLPAGTVLVTEDGVRRDPWLPLLLLEVLAAELGEFLQVDGRVLAAAEADGFDLVVDPGQEVDVDRPLAVMLQADGVDFNGTRIVSRDGELLDHTALTASQGVQVDGVLELPGMADPLLRAALVIVNPDVHGDAERLSGVVLSVAGGLVVVDPDADRVCGEATDRLELGSLDRLDVFTVTIDLSGSEVAPGGAPAAGQAVGVSGLCASGGFVADDLIVVDDRRG